MPDDFVWKYARMNQDKVTRTMFPRWKTKMHLLADAVVM